MFGIAVGRVWREVEGALASMPGEHTSLDGAPAADPFPEDELSARRARRRKKNAG